jgi:homocitrate synthase NifV
MRVFITDTTLREGMQSPSLELTYEQRKELFFLLSSTGIHELEVGVPAHSEEERDYIKELIKSQYGDKVIVWNRANVRDVDASLECGAKRLEVAIPVSDIMIKKKMRKSRDYIVGLAKEIVSYVKSKNLYISVGFEDVSRADRKFVIKLLDCIKREGADRVRLSDTVGVLEPLQTVELVKMASSFLDVEVHFHNDFGMATANSITAFFSGAKYINASLLGLGERCGITSLEEVVFYLELIQGVYTGVNLKKLYKVLEQFMIMTNIKPSPNKPLVGRNAFTNKSSIHIDGLTKSVKTYLPFDPTVIKSKPVFAFGLYSGRSQRTQKLCQKEVRDV